MSTSTSNPENDPLEPSSTTTSSSTPTSPCSKELWLKFLASWRDEAQGRGSKAAQTYNKAHRSLSACPIPFQHPSQTVQLVGIGPTIAKRLTDELERWCKQNGQPMPQRPEFVTTKAKQQQQQPTTVASADSHEKEGKEPEAGETVAVGETTSLGEGSERGEREISLKGKVSSSGSTGGCGSKKVSQKKSRLKKPYIPQPRSGGYGLLLGLFSQTHSGDGGDEVYLTKADLITFSQPHCDSDYTHSSGGGGSGAGGKGGITASLYTAAVASSSSSGIRGGSTMSAAGSTTASNRSFHTAWASMKVLINKGYVYQTGNPPKFCLSEEGFQVARTIAKDAGVRQIDGGDGGGEGSCGATGAKLSFLSTSSPSFSSGVRRELEDHGDEPNRGESNGTPAVVPSSKCADGGSDSDLKRKRKTGLKLPSPTAAQKAAKPPRVGRTHDPNIGTRSLPAVEEGHLLPELETNDNGGDHDDGDETQVFRYAYLTAEGPGRRNVKSRGEAAMRLSDRDYSMTYSVEFPRVFASSPFVKLCIEGVEENPTRKETLVGWIRHASANLLAPGIGTMRTRKVVATSPDLVNLIRDSSDEDGEKKGSRLSQAEGSGMKQRRNDNVIEVDDFDDHGILEMLSDGERSKPATAAPGPAALGSSRRTFSRTVSGPEFGSKSLRRDHSINHTPGVEGDSVLISDPGQREIGREGRRVVVRAASGKNPDRHPLAVGSLVGGTKRRCGGPRLSSIVPPPAAEGMWYHNPAQPPSRAKSGNEVERMIPGCSDTATSSSSTSRIRRSVSEQQKGADLVSRVMGGQSEKGDPTTTTTATTPLEELQSKPITGPPSSNDYQPPSFEPITLPQDSFTIHLILDNREIRNHWSKGASGGSRRTSLAEALASKGVAVETRALELGDALWIARRKGGGGAEGDEVVLDYVVERKRLDDLTSSIVDGRWKEQKFRLSSAGLSQVIYLIEDHDVENQMKKFGSQIQTALSSTQVVDGFFVERTPNTDASIEYLARMHRVIEAMHENVELSVIPDKVISRPTYLRLQAHLRRARPSRPHLTTFSSYQSLNSKSASTTLRDTWARMLLAVKGMSAEKVSELLEVWQCPRQLWEEYRSLSSGADDQDREAKGRSLISDRCDPLEKRRKVGHPISFKLHQVFTSEEYLA
ncbi:hypothetical protein IE53DRAFT_386468 [Violaceomyces palustris]|uniref:Uncharacterized protein n=1 Tax=Violaceomyces palustris TaxID=1673888 RepID=A0ACD0NZA7_9BASI|nr:hypothetical protein IE53DRAFT_386468 [Violaceomyces palustris]